MTAPNRVRGRAARWLLAAAIALIVASVALWVATGREGFTRWPSTKLAESDLPPTEEDAQLLSSLGFTPEPEDAGARLVSRFAFGLLPGGFDARHLPSVLLCVSISFAMFGAIALRSFFTRHTQGGIS